MTRYEWQRKVTAAISTGREVLVVLGGDDDLGPLKVRCVILAHDAATDTFHTRLVPSGEGYNFFGSFLLDIEGV